MDISWILPQRLAVGPTPLQYSDLQSLAYQGIRTIVTLTESSLFRFADITPELVIVLNLTLVHHGFADDTSPSRLLVQRILTDVVICIRDQRPVYLHCFGGRGRTGTVLHLLLLEAGLSLVNTQKLIRQHRPQCLRLNSAQAAFVGGWYQQRLIAAGSG